MSLLVNIFRKRMQQAADAAPPSSPVPKAPLGLVPGSVWTPSDVDLSLAQADGSIIKVINTYQIVDQVGVSTLFGMNIYTHTFKGSEHFLQTVTDTEDLTQVRQLRLFTHHSTVLASTVDDVEFWLGALARDDAGNVVRDKWGNSQIVEFGLIGWSQFQIDGPPALVYNRQWATTDNQPIRFKEKIVSHNAVKVQEHQAMEYARRLTSHSDSTVEYLFVTFLGDTGTVKVYVGVDLDPSSQNIISAS